MIVVDASLLIDLILGGGSQASDFLITRLRAGEVLCAPHLVDAEVGQGLRRFAMRGDLTDSQARSLLVDFMDVPIKRYPHGPLLARAFEFRWNATVYDGLYLALSEALDCPFFTGDGALRNVPGCQARVEVLVTSA